MAGHNRNGRERTEDILEYGSDSLVLASLKRIGEGQEGRKAESMDDYEKGENRAYELGKDSRER